MFCPRAAWAVVALALVAVGCGQPGGGKPAGGGQIAWLHDYEAAQAAAKQSGRPLRGEVSTSWCSACKTLDETVLSKPAVGAASRQFVPVRVDGDKRPDLVKQLAVSGYPTVVFQRADGKELGRVRGVPPREQDMLEEMRSAAQAAR